MISTSSERTHFVYVVTNLINDKWYVGKTSNTVSSRWSDHRSEARQNKGYYFHNAIRKDGEENFVVQTVADVETLEEANSLENLWIILLKSHEKEFGYNLTFGGEGAQHTSLTIKKFSEKQRGRPLSEAHKQALRVPKKNKRIPPVFRPDIPNSELIRLYVDGLSCASIASLFNTNRATVSWRLRKAGVIMRPVGFQKHTKPKESIK